jgi:hypothetical protein
MLPIQSNPAKPDTPIAIVTGIRTIMRKRKQIIMKRDADISHLSLLPERIARC